MSTSTTTRNASRSAIAANPFALMMNPEEVLSVIERSEALGKLKLRRIQSLDDLPPTTRTKESAAPSFEKEMDEANFPLWKDLIASSDPDFIPKLFS